MTTSAIQFAESLYLSLTRAILRTHHHQFALGAETRRVGTITGLDYWTHPPLVQCRSEAKRTYSLSHFANTAPYRKDAVGSSVSEAT